MGAWPPDELARGGGSGGPPFGAGHSLGVACVQGSERPRTGLRTGRASEAARASAVPELEPEARRKRGRR